MTTTAALDKAKTTRVRLDPQALLTQAVEKGAGIETLERLVALAKDVRAETAQAAWYEAMAEFQRTCPTIKKTATAKIKTARADYSYHYAPLDQIMGQIQPVMTPLGLSISWRSPRVEAGHVVVSCWVSHLLGHHEESGDTCMPIGQAAEIGANAAQRVGMALTYAKRYSLLAIIGLAPEDDDDRAGHDDEPEREGAESEGEPGVTTTVTGVGEVSGLTKGKKWTRYTVSFADGRSASTFDGTLATEAQRVRASKEPVTPVFTEEGGYMNLTDLVLTPVTGPGEDEGGDEKERKGLLSLIHDLAATLKLSTNRKVALWQEHCGQTTAQTAPVASLRALHRAMVMEREG